MTIAVLSIVEVSMNKIALWIRVPVNDWKTERVIIANSVSVASWLLLNVGSALSLLDKVDVS